MGREEVERRFGQRGSARVEALSELQGLSFDVGDGAEEWPWESWRPLRSTVRQWPVSCGAQVVSKGMMWLDVPCGKASLGALAGRGVAGCRETRPGLRLHLGERGGGQEQDRGWRFLKDP